MAAPAVLKVTNRGGGWTLTPVFVLLHPLVTSVNCFGLSVKMWQWNIVKTGVHFVHRTLDDVWKA